MVNVFKNCISCLNKNYLTSINETKDGMSTYDKIKICIPQIVSDNYNMEKGFICINCRSFINNFYQFFMNCMKSKDIIESMIIALKKNDNDLYEDTTLNVSLNNDVEVNENEIEVSDDNKNELELCIENEDNSQEFIPFVQSEKQVNDQIIIEFVDVALSDTNVENEEKAVEESNDVLTSNKDKAKHICNECGKEFPEIWNLKSHIKYVHTDENQLFTNEPKFIKIDAEDILTNKDETGKYQCKICGKICRNISHMKTHIKYKHNEKRDIQCPLCGREFVENGNFQKHLRHHKDHQIYNCDKCRFTCVTEEELTMHKNLLRCYLKEKIKCKYCDTSFHRESALNRHMNIEHLKQKQHMCKLCGKGFLRGHALSLHMQNKHEVRSLTCEICGKKFGSKDNFNRHIKLLHFNDDVKKSNKPRNITENVTQDGTEETADEIKEETIEETTEKTTEDTIEENKETKDNSPTHQCHLCGIVYNGSVETFKKHLQTHPEGKPYKCHLCSVQFNDKNVLSNHIRRVHDREKNHMCHICGKGFFCKRQMEKHIASHLDTNIYSCNICDKKFKDNNNLKRHNLLIHLGGFPKKFQCTICGLKMWSNTDLIRHTRTHTGEKPYSCELCGKSFAIKRQVKVHYLYSHTTSRPFPCTICNKRFPTQYCLNQHMGKHSQNRPYKCEYCLKPFKHRNHVLRHIKRACKKYKSAVPDEDLIRIIDKSK